MRKNIDDIIVPERKRSIREIPIPESRKRVSEKHFPTPDSLQDIKQPINTGNYAPPPPPPPSMRPEFNKMKPRRSRKVLWLSIGIALLVLAFAGLSIFNGATLAYVPKSTKITFEKDIFSAVKIGEGLVYSVVKHSKEKGMEVPASGQSQVSRKASGTIVVYNNASAEPQRLVENTRFETPEGLIYRIPEAIVIPGRKIVDGATQPGSVETIVYADEAGDEYNVGLKDFTVPGLAGTPRFSTIYARSKTPMTGGFVGMEATVSEVDKQRVMGELEAALKEELIQEASAQVPEDFILIHDLAIVKLQEIPQTAGSQPGSAVLNIKGDLEAPMFKRTEISSRAARDLAGVQATEAVDILELESLDFAYVDSTFSDLVNAEEIRFTISGQATVVWETDEVALKSDLLGKHKNDVPGILNNYPAIVSATATTRPFWSGSFPDSAAKISIKRIFAE